jgi:hypothetical protein
MRLQVPCAAFSGYLAGIASNKFDALCGTDLEQRGLPGRLRVGEQRLRVELRQRWPARKQI